MKAWALWAILKHIVVKESISPHTSTLITVATLEIKAFNEEQLCIKKKKKDSRIDPYRSRHIIKKDLLNFSYRLIPRLLKMFPTLQRNAFVLNKSQRAGSWKLPNSHAVTQNCSHALVHFWRPSRVFTIYLIWLERTSTWTWAHVGKHTFSPVRHSVASTLMDRWL